MKLLIGTLHLLSRLPLGVLYVLADVCYPIVYYVARYRRTVVRRNLDAAFPEKSTKERRRIERRFYRWFCDYAAETLKLLTMPADEMKRRMQVEGVEDM